MSGQDDVVNGEESHATFGGCGDMLAVDSEHVGGHIRGEIVDGDREFFRENVGSELGFDACEDLEHSRGENESPKITGWRLGLTQAQGTAGHRGCSAAQCPPTRARKT